ncbi:ribose-phosphate pyrophosphokinase, partial [Ligilactobacillus agilis]
TIPEEKQFANLKVLSIAPVFAKAISLIYNNQSVDSLFTR